METFLESEQSLEVCGVELPSGLVQGRQDRVELPDNRLIGVPVSVHLELEPQRPLGLNLVDIGL